MKKSSHRKCAGLSLLCLELALGLSFLQAHAAADDPLIFRIKVERTDVPTDAFVILTQPGTQIEAPRGAYLEYDIYMGSENVSFGGGVCIVTTKGSVIKEPAFKDQNGIDTHFARGQAGLKRYAKGQWYHRKIPIDTICDAKITEVFLAASAGSADKAGENDIRYRNIALTDESGTVILDLMPRLGSLPYPLQVFAPYSGAIELTAHLISGCFEPDKYLISSQDKMSGRIILKNFDPEITRTCQYKLEWTCLDGKKAALPAVSGTASLEPKAEVEIPVELPFAPPGHYRSRLTLQSGTQKTTIPGYAISVLSPEDLENRKAPFTEDGFGLGAVALSGGFPLSTLPALREEGANYIQLRLNWSQLEPSPGHYEFEVIQPYLDLAKRCGMWVQIDLYSGYPAYTVPRWYWEDTMISNTGQNTLPLNCSVAYWTDARARGLNLLNELLKNYQKEANVVSWNAWLGGNMDGFYLIRGTPEQAGLQDYSDSSQIKFRQYVKEELGLSLEDAAKKYNLRLKTWDDLTQPTPLLGQVDLRPLWYDFMRYRLWSVGAVEKEASSVIAGILPDAEIEYLYGGGLNYLGRNGNDFDKGVSNARAHHGSMHHTASPGAENQVYLGTARRQFNVPFSIETAGTPASPPEHQHAMFELLSQNASAYTYIQSAVWGIMPVPEADYGFGEIRPALERLQNAEPVGTPMAVIFPYTDLIVDPFNTELPGPKEARRFIRRMETVGYNFDVFTDRTQDVEWSQYPVVIAWFSAALEPEFIAQMQAYVKEGGNLILLSDTGTYQPGSKTHYALFEALDARGQPEEMSIQNDRASATFTIEGLTDAKQALNNYHPLPTLPANATSWAEDDAGRPTVATWDYGYGTVMVWAGWPASWNTPATTQSVRYTSGSSPATESTVFPTAFDQLLEEYAFISPPMTSSTSNVLFSLQQKADDYFLILFNNSDQQCQAQLQVPIQEGIYHALNITHPWAEPKTLPAGPQGADLSVDLAPLEVTVIQVSPLEIAKPIWDFPPRARAVPLPENAKTGKALLNMFTSPDQVAGANGRVTVFDGAQLRVTVPTPGFYQITLDVPSSVPAPQLQSADGKTLALTPEVSSDSTQYHVNWKASSVSEVLTFSAKSELNWLRITPDFKNLGKAHISPAFENPGRFPGEAYREQGLIETDFIKTGRMEIPEDWQEVSPQEDGGLDLTAIVGKDNGVAYVAWTFESHEAQTCLLGLGVDYGLKLWLNGELILDSLKEIRKGPPRANEFLIEADLNKGTNVLLAKVAAGSQGWTLQANSNRE